MRSKDEIRRLKRLAELVELVHRREANTLTQLNQSRAALEQECQDISSWMTEATGSVLAMSEFGALRLSRLNAEMTGLSQQADAQAEVVRETQGRMQTVQERSTKNERLYNTREAEKDVLEVITQAFAQRGTRLP